MPEQSHEKQDGMAYIARDTCGCAIAVTVADEHLECVALTVAGWILDGLTIELRSTREVKDSLQLACSHRPQPGGSTRKCFRTLHLVMAVSEDRSLEELSLEDLAYEITDGSSVGQVLSQSDTISPALAARLLVEMGSDPGFFHIDEHGNEADDQVDQPKHVEHVKEAIAVE